MANMPDAMETTIVSYLVKGTTPPALTGPMRIQILSALGAGDAAGTPVASAIINLVTGTVTAGAVDNSAILRWEGLTNPTSVAGFRIMDSAGSPTITLDNIPKTGGTISVTDGILEIPVGDLDITGA